MAITLRADKGTQLTYNELDNNFLSYFYSASISSDQTTLSLFYTGSSGLSISQTSIQIPLNPYTGSTPPVAGNPNTIQYNNAGDFGGDDDFRWDSTNNRVIVGNETVFSAGDKINVKDGAIAVRRTGASSAPYFRYHYDDGSFDWEHKIDIDPDFGHAKFENLSTDTGTNTEFYISAYSTSNPILKLQGKGTISAFNGSTTYGSFSIGGSLLIDYNAGNVNNIFAIRGADSSLTRIGFTDSAVLNSQGNARGTILEGNVNGHILVGIQGNTSISDGQTFSIISGTPPSVGHGATYSKLVAMFKSNGQVGFGKTAITTGFKLEAAGGISGSRLHASADASIGTNISVGGNATITGDFTTSGTVTMNSIAAASSATNYNFLVQESNDIVKQVNAAPIPVGGIILWSGTIANIPSGWALCNGSNGTPDLRDKFVVGATTDVGGVAKTGINGAVTTTGGAINHDHGGNTANHTLTTGQIPAHQHIYKDSYYIEYNDPGVGAGGAISGVDNVGPTTYKGSGDSDSDNKYVYYRLNTTNNEGAGGQHKHGIPNASNLPPYYALAYIMYTG